MSLIKCTLGLVACLSYQDSYIADEDVFVMRLLCSEVYEAPPYSFLMNSPRRIGYLKADQLEELGLEFSWKPKERVAEAGLALYRKREITRACREFEAIANNRANWSK